VTLSRSAEPESTGPTDAHPATDEGGRQVAIIRDGNVRWLAALDVGQMVLVGQLVAVVLLLVVRSVARSRR
jgi:hypothetical protein